MAVVDQYLQQTVVVESYQYQSRSSSRVIAVAAADK